MWPEGAPEWMSLSRALEGDLVLGPLSANPPAAPAPTPAPTPAPAAARPAAAEPAPVATKPKPAAVARPARTAAPAAPAQGVDPNPQPSPRIPAFDVKSQPPASQEQPKQPAGLSPVQRRRLMLAGSGVLLVVVLVLGMLAVLRPYLAKRRAIAEVRQYALAERRVADPGSGLIAELPGGWLALRNENPYVVQARRAAAPRRAGQGRLRRRVGRRAARDDRRPRRAPRRAAAAAARPHAVAARGGARRAAARPRPRPHGAHDLGGGPRADAGGHGRLGRRLQPVLARGVGERLARRQLRDGARGAVQGPDAVRPDGGARRRGRRAAGGRGAGTFEGRAASSRCGEDEPEPRAHERAAGRAARGEPRPRRARRRRGERDARDLPADLGARRRGGAGAARLAASPR